MKNVVIILAVVLLSACGNAGNKKSQDTDLEKVEINLDKVETIEYSVQGMTCTGCENTIKAKVGELRGISNVEVSIFSSR